MKLNQISSTSSNTKLRKKEVLKYKKKMLLHKLDALFASIRKDQKVNGPVDTTGLIKIFGVNSWWITDTPAHREFNEAYKKIYERWIGVNDEITRLGY